MVGNILKVCHRRLDLPSLDTDVVSMLFKGDTRARHFREHIFGRLLGISFMSWSDGPLNVSGVLCEKRNWKGA